jgi:hypothetical protein
MLHKKAILGCREEGVRRRLVRGSSYGWVEGRLGDSTGGGACKDTSDGCGGLEANGAHGGACGGANGGGGIHGAGCEEGKAGWRVGARGGACGGTSGSGQEVGDRCSGRLEGGDTQLWWRPCQCLQGRQ